MYPRCSTWCFEIYTCVNYYNNQVKKKHPSPHMVSLYVVRMCVVRTLEVHCLS